MEYTNFKAGNREIGVTDPCALHTTDMRGVCFICNTNTGVSSTYVLTEKRQPMLKPTFTPSRSQEGWDMNRLEYQKLADRDTKCLSPDIDYNDFEIVSYDAGEHKMKPNGLTFKHFDFVSLICTSMHPIKKVEIHHFTGSRDKVITILNCKKK
ncbi:MAG TPA: hypothetical protein VIM65_17690 [Cyclobacteriaceae bacterium]